MAWRVTSPGQFYDAGESTVVYFDPASGDTHLLSDFAAHLLGLLAQRPMGLEQLLGRIEGDVENPDSTELAASVEGVLCELLALDVVARD